MLVLLVKNVIVLLDQYDEHIYYYTIHTSR